MVKICFLCKNVREDGKWLINDIKENLKVGDFCEICFSKKSVLFKNVKAYYSSHSDTIYGEIVNYKHGPICNECYSKEKNCYEKLSFNEIDTKLNCLICEKIIITNLNSLQDLCIDSIISNNIDIVKIPKLIKSNINNKLN